MGAKTLAGAEGARRRLPERDRRRGAVLRALHRARRRRVAAGVRHARSDVAPRRSNDFPAIVTMDAHGNSLHKDIEQESGQHLETLSAADRDARCFRQAASTSSRTPSAPAARSRVPSPRRRDRWFRCPRSTSSGNGDSSGRSIGLQIAAAASCRPRRGDPCARRRRRGDERLAALAAVDARVGRQLPRARRRTNSAACDGRRRPPRAPATIRTRGSSRDSSHRARRAARRTALGEQRALQRVRERADGQLGDEHRRSGAGRGARRRFESPPGSRATTRSAARRRRGCRPIER